MRSFFKVLSVVAILSFAQAANAAGVHFQLFLDGSGAYELRASSSAGDNGGIASYSAVLVNTNSISHYSPQDSFAGGSGVAANGPVGFTSLRTPDDNASGIVFASQPTTSSPPNLIFGYGQEANSFAALGINDFTGGSGLTQPEWQANLLIATGTYDTTKIPSFDNQSAELFSNVFVDRSGPGTEAASITTEVINVPEPTSILLAGLGLIGFVAKRRRS